MKKKNKYSLSSLSKKDQEILLIWRNNKLVRKWSFNRNKISKKIHKKWIKQNLNKNKNIIRIFKYNQTKCGMVRLNLMKKNYNLNYLIAQNFRRKKLGKIMLTIFLKQLRRKIKRKTFIFAKSKVKNLSSNKCLESVGFKFMGRDKGVNKYIYKIK